MQNNDQKESNIKIILDNEIKRQRTLWIFYTLSPILYLIIALIIDYKVFKQPGDSGFVSLSESFYHQLLILSGILAFFAQVLILSLKPGFQYRIKKSLKSPIQLKKRIMLRSLVLSGICDTVALIGLILFLLRGDIRTVFVFGLVSLIYYAQVYPSKISINNSRY